MKNGHKLLAALSLLSFSTIGLASPTTSGIYLGANFGAGYFNILNIFGPGSTTISGGFAANTNLGFQFNSFIALETGFSAYTNMGSMGENAYTSHIAGKLMIPFTDRFNLFFKLGGGLIYAQGDSSTHGGLYGTGAAVALTKQLDLVVQTSGVTQFVGTIGLYSAGLTYHFKTL